MSTVSRGDEVGVRDQAHPVQMTIHSDEEPRWAHQPKNDTRRVKDLDPPSRPLRARIDQGTIEERSLRCNDSFDEGVVRD